MTMYYVRNGQSCCDKSKNDIFIINGDLNTVLEGDIPISNEVLDFLLKNNNITKRLIKPIELKKIDKVNEIGSYFEDIPKKTYEPYVEPIHKIVKVTTKKEVDDLKKENVELKARLDKLETLLINK